MILQTVGFFHSAHFLSNYLGKCKNIHGHTYAYFISILLTNVKLKNGMLFDFSTINKTFDHKLLCNENDKSIFNEHEVLYMKGNPTAENIALYIAKMIKSEVPNCSVIVRLWEDISNLINIQKLKNAEGEYIEVRE